MVVMIVMQVSCGYPVFSHTVVLELHPASLRVEKELEVFFWQIAILKNHMSCILLVGCGTY